MNKERAINIIANLLMELEENKQLSHSNNFKLINLLHDSLREERCKQ